MSRFFMIDIGAGTMDMLWYDTDTNEYFKAVAPSPVRTIAAEIRDTQGPLRVTGVEMGGGPVTQALQQRAKEARVAISREAAATLHHDPERVRTWGLEVGDEELIRQTAADPRFTPIVLGDVQPDRINAIINGLGLPTSFDAVVLCAQDHGVAPRGVSHLDFRHNLFRDMLNRTPQPHALIFPAGSVPKAFNRLNAMARGAQGLDAQAVYVMDSGMAAMAGGARDIQVADLSPVIILDIATSHTVAATMEGDSLAGVFEYHTQDITLTKLEGLLKDLADGSLDHEKVLAEGGHGAFLRKAVGFDNIKAIVATGPKRRLVMDSKLSISWGAPWGDNMMTGCVGMLAALRAHKGLPAMRFV